MNEDSTVLLTIKLDEGQTEARVKAINQQLKFFSTTAKGLEKDLNDGIISQRQYTEAMGRIEEQSKKLNTELTYQKKVLDDARKGIVAGSGSLNEMRAKAESAKQTFAALTETERNNIEVGGQLKKRIDELDAAYKLAEQGTDRYNRQAGAAGLSNEQLGKAIAELTQEYDGLSASERKNADVGGLLLKQINELKDAQDKNQKVVEHSRKGVTDYIRELTPFGIKIGDVADGFKAGTQGIGTFAKALFTARGAATALLAVPIVGLFTLLLTVLTKTQGGMDFLERTTTAISAAFNVLINTGVKLADALSNVFKEPAKVYDALISLLKGIPREIASAVEAGSKLAANLQQLREEERALGVEREKNLARIESLKKAAEDTTKSTTDRANAAQAAYNLENDLLQRGIKIQERKRDLAKEELRLGQDTAEARDKVADAEKELYKMRADSATRQTEIQNKVNELNKQGAQEQINLEIATINETIRLKREAGELLADEQKQLLDKQLELDLAGVVKGGKVEQALRLKYKADLAKLEYDQTTEANNKARAQQDDERTIQINNARDDARARLQVELKVIDDIHFSRVTDAEREIKNKADLAQKIATLDSEQLAARRKVNQQIKDVELKAVDDLLAARLARTKAGSKKEQDVIIEQIRTRIKNALYDERVGSEEFQRIQAEGFRQIDEIQGEGIKKQVLRYADAAGQLTSEISSVYEAHSQQVLNELDRQQTAALNSAGTNAQLRGEIEEKAAAKRLEIEKQSARNRAKIARVEAIINTARSITEVASDPIRIALALITGLAQQLIISSNANNFADGGVPQYFSTYNSDRRGNYIGSGPGTSRSDSIPARISVGESVINAEATRRHYTLLSAINASTGGRRFPGAEGLSLSEILNRPSPVSYDIPRFQSGQVNVQPDLSAMTQAIIDGINRVQPVLVVDNLNQVQADQTLVKTHTAYGGN